MASELMQWFKYDPWCNFLREVNPNPTIDEITQFHETFVAQQDLRGYRNALIKQAENRYMKRLSNGQMDDLPGIAKLRSNGLNPLGYFMWITINASESTKISALKKAVEKYVKRKTITSAFYSFEQRGTSDEDLGKGPHCHMLVTQLYDHACNFKQDLERSFRNICDLNCGAKHHILNWKKCIPSHLDKRINYVKGVKKDTLKCDMVSWDRKWRLNKGLEDTYDTGLLAIATTYVADKTSAGRRPVLRPSNKGGSTDSDSSDSDDDIC